MNILVVGGAGYIGSHMVKYLGAHTAHRSVVLDNLARGHAAAVDGAELVVGDFGDAALVADLCRKHQVDAILHFAADSQVGESMVDPAKYYQNNVVNGKALVDAALGEGVKRFIFSSTAAVYGNPLHTPIDEADACLPVNPYGRTKLAFEQLLQSYAEAYGLQYTCLRYFNAAGADPSGSIGEDHTPESHLIPLVLQVAQGQRASIEVYGDDYATPDGTCVRDYIHVNDLAAAHLLALDRLVAGGDSGSYNLGNGQGFSVQQVLDVCRTVTGHPIPALVGSRRPGDPAVLVASATRARADLGWQPAFSTLTSIVETAWRWHGEHPMGYGC
jgi:UDP-glucose 4-epimerase